MGKYYKRMFPESYAEGRVHLSFTISREADDLIREKEISNASAFVNDLIVGALRGTEYLTKRALANFESAKEEMLKAGFKVNVQSIEKNVLNTGSGGDNQWTSC